jgi:hypothetical protein
MKSIVDFSGDNKIVNPKIKFMLLLKSIKSFLSISFFSLFVILTSCNNNSGGTTGGDDCFAGLSNTQKELLKKIISSLKDSSKITSSNAIGFGNFLNKEGRDFSASKVTTNAYTEKYLADFFKILDLSEFPVTDANRYYQKYVAFKCARMERDYPTEDGAETKSVLVSVDSMYKLVNALKSYQDQTSRKTGVRVVFANYDDVQLGSRTKSGQLTYFMVGTLDTLTTPSITFNWQVQKDMTILGSSWSIPAVGLSVYNHGELCPKKCDIVDDSNDKNTKYWH